MIYTKKGMRNRIAELKVQKAMCQLRSLPVGEDLDWEISFLEDTLKQAEAATFKWKDIKSIFKKK